MNELTTMNSRVYTDIQGLQKLKYTEDQQAAKKEVAQQFEAILMQMVLSSMQDANKAFSSGLFGSDQMEMYQDLYNKQLALTMSKTGTGFAAMIEKNLDQQANAVHPADSNSSHILKLSHVESKKMEKPEFVQEPEKVVLNQEKPAFATPEDFVNKLWSSAKIAASIIGGSPEMLLAQAALETNWGKNVISKDNGNNSTYNLFNIKADNSWSNDSVAIDSLEERNGVLVKEKSNFRSYNSFTESFIDYVNFLKDNNRYNNALGTANDPKHFAHALQDAGYATDHQYADKILKIYSSPSFQQSVAKVKSNV